MNDDINDLRRNINDLPKERSDDPRRGEAPHLKRAMEQVTKLLAKPAVRIV
jgi:hypothetical protein